MSEKKLVSITLVFHREGVEGEQVFHYTHVNRIQRHRNEYGHISVSIHRETEVHTHSENAKYRLVKASKVFG